MAFSGSNRDYRKRDLEALSLAKTDGVSQQTFARVANQLAAVKRQIAAPTSIEGAIDNLLTGSDFDHSVLSFTGAGLAGQVYPWVRGVNSGSPIMNTATNPLWNDVEGWLEWEISSDSDDLSYQFDKRIIRPGFGLFLQLNARLKYGSLSAAGMSIEAGIWDTTGGIDNWLGASLAGSAGLSTILLTKVGPDAPVTNYTYVVVATTDQNEVVVSEPETIMGAAALTATDFIQVSWQPTGGVVQYRIFRTSPNPGLIGTVGPGPAAFQDKGGALLAANAPIPQPSGSRARVAVADFGLGLTNAWRTFRFPFKVPRNYNFSLTGATDQWLRVGLRGSSPATIQVDRIGLSFAPGAWQPSIFDRGAVSDVVISPVGDGEQQNIGMSGN